MRLSYRFTAFLSLNRLVIISLHHQIELSKINDKWELNPAIISAKTHLTALSFPLRDILFELIDQGHPPGKETIKRNLELGELCGLILSQFIGTGYRLGLEYGSLGIQSTPINSPESLPLEVTEMFIVVFQLLNDLFIRLLTDIFRARGMSEKDVVKKQEDFNTMAFGVLISSYKLGVATATEN